MKQRKASLTLYTGTLEELRAYAIRVAKHKSRPFTLYVYATNKPDAFLLVHIEGNRKVVEYALGLQLLHSWTIPPRGKLALVTTPTKEDSPCQ